MSNSQAAELMVAKLKSADIAYAVGAPLYSDETYNEMRRMLRLFDPESPYLHVAANYRAAWDNRRDALVRHTFRMGSLRTLVDDKELLAWWNAQETSAQYQVELKADGVSVRLLYREGLLIEAALRGDTEVGEPVLATAFKAQGIPIRIDASGDVEVRGELVITAADFTRLNATGAAYVNTRNAAAGIARSQQPEESAFLSFIAFDIYRKSEDDWFLYRATQAGNHRLLKALGFRTACWKEDMEVTTVEQVMAIRAAVSAQRESLPYEIDGIVLKHQDSKTRMLAAWADDCPGLCCAVKFEARATTTRLLDIEYSLGRTGAIIPTGILEPVPLGGVTVSRALLCNFEYIEKLGVKLGDLVVVERRGDVIPNVTALAATYPDSRPISVPTVCPVLGGAVTRGRCSDGTPTVHVYSVDYACSEQCAVAGLVHWAKILDLKGLGPKYAEAFVRLCGVRNPAELYRLRERGVRELSDAHTGKLLVGPAVVTKLLARIEQLRTLPIAKLIAALGLEDVGSNTSEILVTCGLDSMGALLNPPPDLEARVKATGREALASSIRFSLESRRAWVESLQAQGVQLTKHELPPQSTGPVYLLTGSFFPSKDFYHAQIQEKGGTVAAGWNKKVSVLVAADDATNTIKSKNARAAGIPVIGVDELKARLAAETL